MTDQLTQWVESIMSLVWIYPITSLLVTVDALFPLVPSETILSLGGAWSGATGTPSIGGLIIAAIIGGFIGDNALFFLGRKYGRRINNFSPDSKPGRALAWVKRNLRNNAGATIIIARFIPWGRWVSTLLLGSVSFPWGRFLFYDVIGTVLWACINIGVGYLGGMLFKDQPLIALLAGIIAGTLVGLLLQRLQNQLFEWMDEKRAKASA